MSAQELGAASTNQACKPIWLFCILKLCKSCSLLAAKCYFYVGTRVISICCCKLLRMKWAYNIYPKMLPYSRRGKTVSGQQVATLAPWPWNQTVLLVPLLKRPKEVRSSCLKYCSCFFFHSRWPISSSLLVFNLFLCINLSQCISSSPLLR